MTNLRTVIIEDEIPSQEVLINYLGTYCKEVEVVAVAKSLRSGIEAIKTFRPNLVLLDIRLPDGISFDLFKEFSNVDFKVIFITAYSEYAVKAFRISATDYLLKPLKIDDLIQAIDKAKSEILQGLDMRNLEVLLKNLNNPGSPAEKLVVHENTGFRVLDTKDIIMCKADGYCCKFYLVGEQPLVASKILKYYEEILPDSIFFRIHNSYLVNLKHVKIYNHNGFVELTDGISASVGNTFRKKFLEYFNKLR